MGRELSLWKWRGKRKEMDKSKEWNWNKMNKWRTSTCNGAKNVDNIIEKGGEGRGKNSTAHYDWPSAQT